MRSEGRLAPPPQVDYVHTRPRDTETTFVTFEVGPSSRPARSRARKLVYERTTDADLDAVEQKLDDFDKDAMGVDDTGRCHPDAEQDAEEDPHNIDDLYGDVAPRYRGKPPKRSKSKTAPLPPPLQETVLLFSERDKRRPRVDDLGLLLDKKLKIEEKRRARGEVTSRPRKLAAPQMLEGKDLKKRQRAGLYFSIHEERERATASEPLRE